MEKRQKNRAILSHRYSDPRFRRKKTGSSHTWDSMKSDTMKCNSAENLEEEH